MHALPKRRGVPRLPWKRGPVAWEVGCRAEEILAGLARCPRRFLSLRCAARFLGVSTQPLRDWIRRKDLKRDGPRFQISKDELCRFVKLLQERAEPFDSDGYLERLHRKRERPPRRFEKLSSARFAWPKGRTALNPKELAQIVGCHPSLIVKAIRPYSSFNRVRGRRRTRCRWEITKRSWDEAFPFSLIKKRRLPGMPQGDLLSTVAVASHLRACGMEGAEAIDVRRLIQNGSLQAVHRSPNGRNWYVTKAGLKEFRKSL
jgi:hypothetical protein